MLSRTWAPGAVRAPARHAVHRQLGQTSFLQSPGLALTTDIITMISSAYIAYDATKKGSGWSSLFWIISAASLVKAFHDAGR